MEVMAQKMLAKETIQQYMKLNKEERILNWSLKLNDKSANYFMWMDFWAKNIGSQFDSVSLFLKTISQDSDDWSSRSFVQPIKSRETSCCVEKPVIRPRTTVFLC